MNGRTQHPATPPASGGVCFGAAGQTRPNHLLLVLAVVLAGGSAAWLLCQWRAPGAYADKATLADSQPADDGEPSAPADAEVRAGAATRAALAARAARDPNDLARYVTPGQPAPTMGEVIARLHDAGVHEGLGAFNPPGTSPPLAGLAVPEDFALPPGYVRHYQATDDGQRIEPILMFSPDYEFFDGSGRPIAIPESRVVPPELAPPDLPRRNVVIPPPLDPGSPAP
jgi:hypothetical protein